MKKKYSYLFFFFCTQFLFFNTLSAQTVSILTPNDTIVCRPDTFALRAAIAPLITNVSNPNDDDYAPVTTPIGFTFNFYGTNYTRCLISSNGYVSFNLADSGMFSQWNLQSAPGLPGNTICVNSICGVYEDIYLVPGGNISTGTRGTAPNRQFFVNFCNCPMFLPGSPYFCSALETFQIILYETSNNIEVHITNKHSCSAWNGGLAIEGVQDATGTYGTPVPGRNNSVWTATNDAYRFVPTSATNYTVAPIAYAPLPTTGSIGFPKWYIGATLIDSGLSIVVSDTANTTYTAKFQTTQCGVVTTSTQNVEILVGRRYIIRDSATDPSTCGACNGKMKLLGMDPSIIDSIHYRKNSVWQPVIAYQTLADSIGRMPNLCAGIYDSLWVIPQGGVCPSNLLGPITLNDPPMAAIFTDSINFGCHGDTVLFSNSSFSVGAKTISYTWDYGDSTSGIVTNPVHIFSKQNVYPVKLKISNTYCVDSVINYVNTRHPLHSVFSLPKELLCQGESITMSNASIDTTRLGIPPSYAWYFGDGAIDNTMNPTFAYSFEDTGNYTIMMIVKDFVPCYDTSYNLVTVMSKPNGYVMDSSFCSPNTDIPIGLTIKNADSYIWSTGAITPTIIPDTAGIYVVKTTNHCGSNESSVKVILYDCDKCLFVPSAFTPNDDGLNDVFHVRMVCPIRNYGIKIFNRYGQIVYTSYYVSQGWDGKFNGEPVDMGTYLYEITYTPDLPNAHELYKKGDVTVIR